MNWFHLLGTLNTAFIFISLIGVFSQLRKVWLRKRDEETKHQASELLSLNQFSVSFLAYFSFFIYGYSIESINHYIVWPRFIASLLVGQILYEIWRDRRTWQSAICIIFAAACLMLGICGYFGGTIYSDVSRLFSVTFIVIITLMLAQGYYHQIMLIIRSGKTGAVDIRMSQFILMMDISTIIFALYIGVTDGWPLLLLATTSGITKLIIMYLFHWVKVSKTAKVRAAAC